MVVVGDGPARARLAGGASRRRASSASQRGDELAAHYASADAVPVPEPVRHLRQRRRSRRSPPACRWSRSTAPPPPSTSTTASAAGWSRPATRPASSPPSARSPRSRQRARSRCAPPRVAAARRAAWDEVLARFEARLQDTVDALPSAASPRSRRGLSSDASERCSWIERERSVALLDARRRRRAPGSCRVARRRSAGSATAGSGTRSSSALPWCGRRRSARSASVRMIGVGVVNLVLYKIVKRWIARPRPYPHLPRHPRLRALARRVQLPERPHAALGRVQPDPDRRTTRRSRSSSGRSRCWSPSRASSSACTTRATSSSAR